MKKKNYYEFTNFSESEPVEESVKENIKRLKFIIIGMISLITIILIIVVNNINIGETNKQEIQNGSAITQKEIEEKNQNEDNQNHENNKENLEEENKQKELKLPELTQAGIENMENIYHSDTKRAFLTFDDGPSKVTHQILDTLASEGVKATFFMLGMNVEVFPETTKRLYEEGHYIANHGYTHQYSSIYSSVESVLDEYNRCNEAVQKAIEQPKYNSHLFRFPGGIPGGKYASLKKEARQLLVENNILSIDWNALTGDAESQHPEEETLMNKLQNTTEGKNSVVILMHDAPAKQVTADMLPRIIKYLKEQGYEFKTFYDIIQ